MLNVKLHVTATFCDNTNISPTLEDFSNRTNSHRQLGRATKAQLVLKKTNFKEIREISSTEAHLEMTTLNLRGCSEANTL